MKTKVDKTECIKCQVNKELNFENFQRDYSTKTGFSFMCKECARENKRRAK